MPKLGLRGARLIDDFERTRDSLYTGVAIVERLDHHKAALVGWAAVRP